MKRKPKKRKKVKVKSISPPAPAKPLSRSEAIFWLIAWIPLSFVLAYVVGGFVGGFLLADAGYSILGNTIGRVFVGLLMGYFSFISVGFPPRDFGPGKPINFWPYIYGTWAVLFCIPFAVALFNPSPRQTQDPKSGARAALRRAAEFIRDILCSRIQP